MGIRTMSAAAAIFTALTTMSVPSAQAAQLGIGCGVERACITKYYSTPTHTTQVGQYAIGCDGVVRSWGQKTIYSTFFAPYC